MKFYHGTSPKNGQKIAKEGFVPDKTYNWDLKSKKGFVYLSLAYSPFYAMAATKSGKMLAIVCCEVDEENLYPDDDFVLTKFYGKNHHEATQALIDKVDLEEYKDYWADSLSWMGNAAARPEDVTVLGVRYFDGSNLIWKFDPVMSPMNYMFMGNYYRQLSDWIYEGHEVIDFDKDGVMLYGKELAEQMKKEREKFKNG